MSDNEFDAQRDRAEEAPDNVVLTGEEIELPGEDSDASAIIGESSEPIHTGEIEAVAIGGLTGRVPAAAPLKPTIEDKISTGELPIVSAPEGDLPVISSSDEAEATPEQEQAEQESPADAPVADQGTDEPAEADAPAAEATEEPETAEDAPHEAPVEEATEDQAPAVDAASDEPAPASSNEEGEQPEASSHLAEDAENSFASLLSSTDEATADEATEDATEDTEPALAPVMTPAQAAAALSEANDEATDEAEAPSSEDEPSEGKVAAVGGAAAEASTHSPSSRRSMIFGDDETLSPSIPAVAAQENAPAETSAEDEPTAEEATPFTEPTAQLPTQDTKASYSFEDQDAAEATRPRRRSLLGEGNEDSEAATLAAIASTAARGDKSGAPSSLDDEIFSAAPEITEMPSRTGAHWLSFLLFLLLVPAGWYLAADAGARMTLADAAPMYTGVASIVALGELLGAIIISAILFVVARRSSLGAWLMGIVTLIMGLPWLMAPGITAASVLSALTALTNTGSLGANLSHHLQASGYSGRFALLGIALIGLAYVSHSARRTGRAEEALRTSIEATNPAGAFYSKRARKKAAKDAARK
ncbi:MFS transporter [Sanguibacter keddieii]|uniref:MFS transporter n=1 Tax=Sanguibacter keddieii TaxID=60920 RepID=UPI000660486D|nr:MFS transporter [Sanguibacter keddieii]